MKWGKALNETITDANIELWKRKAVGRGFGGSVPSPTCAPGPMVRELPSWVGDLVMHIHT